jgi:hypothetical protein
MRKPGKSRPKAVREPVQVYLASDDSALLASLAEEAGLSKAEVLRRGLRSFGRERGAASPMLRFMNQIAKEPWNEVIGDRLDEVLAEEYLGRRRR